MTTTLLLIILSVVILHTDLRYTRPAITASQIALAKADILVEPKYYPPNIYMVSCNGTIVYATIDIVNSGDVYAYAKVDLIISGKVLSAVVYSVAAHSTETKYLSKDVPDCSIHREDVRVRSQT